MNLEFGHGTSDLPDAARAGAAAARAALGAIRRHPLSCVFVFASVAYDLTELLGAIVDAAGDGVPVIGASTAGEICDGCRERSVVVAALASPHLSVCAAVGESVSKNWRRAFDDCARSPSISRFLHDTETLSQSLRATGEKAFAIMFSPGNTRYADSHACELVNEFNNRSGGAYPLIGGGCADDWHMEENYVFLGRRAYRDSMLMAFCTTGLAFGMGSAHGFVPTAKPLIVSRCSGHEIFEFDGTPAIGALSAATGFPISELQGKHFAQTTCIPFGYATAYDEFGLSVGSYFTPAGGIRTTHCFSEGAPITLMESRPDLLASAGKNAVIRALWSGGIRTPAAALMFSCALRSRIAGHTIESEIARVKSVVPDVPVAGFISFGELAPGADGRIHSNNDTVAALVFGDEVTELFRLAGERTAYEKMLRIQHATAVRLSTAVTVDDAFSALMEGICDTGEFDSGGAYLFREDERSLELVYHSGLGDAFIAAANRYEGESLNVRKVVAGEPIYHDFVSLETLVYHRAPIYRTEGVTSVAAIPLRHEGAIVGSLNVASHRSRSTSDIVKGVLETMATTAAGVLFRILAHERLRVSNDNLDMLYNTIADFIFIVGADGFVVDTNAVVERRLGYGADEIARMRAVDFHPAERRDEAAAIIGDMLAGLRETCEIPLKAKDGGLIPVETRVTRGTWNGREAIFGVSRDISERVRIENELRIRNDEYDRLVSTIPIGIFTIAATNDSDPRFVYVSPRWCEINQLTREEALANPSAAFSLIHPDEMENFYTHNVESYENGSFFTWEGRFVINGQVRHMHIESQPSRVRDGTLIWNGIIYDITERVAAQEALRVSEEKYRFITENMNDIVWTMDLSLHTTSVSPSIERVLGFTPEERLSQQIEEQVTPDSLSRIRELFAEEMRREEMGVDPNRSVTIETEFRRKDGTALWMVNNILAIRDQSGAIAGIYGVSRDISERKAAEQRLTASLAEKEALLHEVHHRVKNNLQIIASLVSLQQNRAPDATAVSILADLHGRIMTISAVHELLYRTGNFAGVNITEYVRTLSSMLLRSFASPELRVDIRYDAPEEIEFAMDRAIPLGLIVNELVTNSLKYAFRGSAQGTITIGLRRVNGCIQLRYHDTGPGLPADVTVGDAKTLGMLMIATLARQLRAAIKVPRGDGFSFILTCER
ncbi:MAG TPA: PAS domain S-box protein [Spirochaetota bacterium]|nr:PAS domain S-box protein [Spirochaetota bacterium]